jgi:phosphoglucomutase
MTTRAGQLAQDKDLVDIPALLDSYHDLVPDPSVPSQAVSFGTSGHRGSSFNRSFNEAHIAAITAAIVDFRRDKGIRGPIFLGRDTHALSEPAFLTVLEVLAAAEVPALIDERDGFTPTPAVSHAILGFNAGKSREDAQADGIIVTPSHNPPADGGIKYNPPHGGPAGTETTTWIAERANQYLAEGWEKIPRTPFQRAFHLENTENFDYVSNYVDDLESVIDLDVIRSSGLKIGADPLGGASVDYWAAIAEDYDLNLDVVHPDVDPTWSFMTLDWDENIRMDCSSPYAMAGLIASRNDFDIATGNDADADRHGIVTPDAGLMNPNHYLAAAIDYLLDSRTNWPRGSAIGKTLVTSSIVDRIVAAHNRTLFEVPRRLQMVRSRPARFDVGLRRRGIGRRIVPAQRRQGVVDGQGRHHPRPPCRRDDCEDRADSLTALRRTGREPRHQLLRASGCSGDARTEGTAGFPGCLSGEREDRRR